MSARQPTWQELGRKAPHCPDNGYPDCDWVQDPDMPGFRDCLVCRRCGQPNTGLIGR